MIDNRMKAVRAKPKAIWYAWFPGDYASKTATLTLVEHGAYRVLLDHYYQMGGKVVANATDLLRVCRAFAEAEQAAVAKVLAEFFEERDGYYHHERADAELAKRALLREKRAQAGSKGGKQKVANATNLLGGLPPTTTTTTTDKESTLPTQDQTVAIATTETPPSGGEVKPSFGKKPKKKTNGLQMTIPDDEVGSIMHHWNAMAEFNGLSQVKMLTPARKQKIQARLSEFGGLEPLSKVIDAVESQPFLLGKTGKGWKADFDWLMEPSNIAKVAEMKYLNGATRNGHH